MRFENTIFLSVDRRASMDSWNNVFIAFKTDFSDSRVPTKLT